MPISHPSNGQTLHSVKETAVWFSVRGLQTSVPSLNSARHRGNGPGFLKIGKLVYYPENELEKFLLSKISPVVKSTSEMKAVAPQIEKER